MAEFKRAILDLRRDLNAGVDCTPYVTSTSSIYSFNKKINKRTKEGKNLTDEISNFTQYSYSVQKILQKKIYDTEGGELKILGIDSHIAYTKDYTDTDFYLAFPFSNEVEDTYKFMGMDVDKDMNCVIPLLNGTVGVLSLIPTKKFLDNFADGVSNIITEDNSSTYNLKIDPSNVIKYLNSVLFKDNEKGKNPLTFFAHYLITYLKNGGLYDIGGGVEYSSTAYLLNTEDAVAYARGSFDKPSMIFKSFVYDSHMSDSVTLPYNSVILNLIHAVEDKSLNALGDMADMVDDGGNMSNDFDRFKGIFNKDEKGTVEYIKQLSAIYVTALTTYWGIVSRYYSGIKDLFGLVDLWCDISKKALGEKEFNAYYSNCFQEFDSETLKFKPMSSISFNGVSHNEGVSTYYEEDNGEAFVIHMAERLAGVHFLMSNSVFPVRNMLMDSMSKEIPSAELPRLLASNVGDIDKVRFDWGMQDGDFIELDAGTSQALSLLDTMRYLDDDALTPESGYDLLDKEDRKAYLDNFIEFYRQKYDPNNDYGDFGTDFTTTSMSIRHAVSNGVIGSLSDKMEYLTKDILDKRYMPLSTFDEKTVWDEKGKFVDLENSENEKLNNNILVTNSEEELKFEIDREDLRKISKLVYKVMNVLRDTLDAELASADSKVNP